MKTLTLTPEELNVVRSALVASALRLSIVIETTHDAAEIDMAKARQSILNRVIDRL